MNTAIAYLRISDDPLDQRLGVDRQRQDVTALAERLGARLVHIYEDNDVSATKVRKADTDWHKALEHLRVMYPDTDWLEANPQMRLAAANSAQDDKFYVVCTEGVGWHVTSGEPLVLPLWVSWMENGERRGGMAQAEVYLSPYEVHKAVNEADEEVDLADLVRKFGDRLESNFWLWHRTLAPKPKRTRKAAK